MVKSATAAFSEAFAVPNLSSLKFEDERNPNFVKSVWSQLSPEIGKKRSFAKFYSTNGDVNFTTPFPFEAGEFVSDRRNGTEIVVSKTKNPKGDEIFVIEVLNNKSVIKTINLSDLDICGNVYFDSELGGVVLNPDASKAAFIAEKKRPKTTPFFPRSKAEANTNETDKKEEFSNFGKEYEYVEEWGEQLLGKSQPVIVTVDMATYEVKVADSESIPDDKSFGELQWIGNDDLVGIAVHNAPYRLGLIYCSNRPMDLFKLDLKSGEYKTLRGQSDSKHGLTIRNPRYET